MTRQGKANIGHLPAFEDKARLITAPFCQNAPALRSALEEEEESKIFDFLPSLTGFAFILKYLLSGHFTF